MSPFNNTIYPKVTLFEEKEKLENFWNKDQSIYFLEQVKKNESLKKYALFRSLLLTGMRKGELLALQEKDLKDDTQTTALLKHCSMMLRVIIRY